ncbi:hypothetical protein U9M48_031301 [Paspalum notatum var. saurae]|uniref:Uncharacterized protein n=1 Tax=Paspalum notatum var. saurae TaxID=547442 RepID=A0AAQ3U4U0_PASNO
MTRTLIPSSAPLRPVPPLLSPPATAAAVARPPPDADPPPRPAPLLRIPARRSRPVAAWPPSDADPGRPPPLSLPSHAGAAVVRGGNGASAPLSTRGGGVPALPRGRSSEESSGSSHSCGVLPGVGGQFVVRRPILICRQ